jgi:hypothetical protein
VKHRLYYEVGGNSKQLQHYNETYSRALVRFLIRDVVKSAYGIRYTSEQSYSRIEVEENLELGELGAS